MRQSQILNLGRDGDGVYLVLTPPAEPIVDGERRFQIALGIVRRAVRRVSGVEADAPSGERSFRFAGSNEKAVVALAQRLHPQIHAIFAAPLTPKVVDRVLGISPSERSRWYKDGRLPHCGNSVIERGAHKIHFPLFPVAAITRLAANPQIIEEWRRDDRAFENSPRRDQKD